ncbi:15968_t:CDS:10 [Funneliformis mosseae]|uniref:15968_t:CDS:1 n=1 Tax=Funneliformis mosseae TaxID=27381 RepID=A0A9N8WRU9_FUNMO|nr:15968_t:CDS:10 [Funneliformis mosseae]
MADMYDQPQSKRRKHVYMSRGDVGEVFFDEWEDIVLGPKVQFLQPVGIVFESLPQNAYESIKIKPTDFELLQENVGKTYLPHSQVPTSIIIGNSMPVQIPQFETYPIHEKLPKKLGHILNVGGSVWAMDWCPNVSSEREQYLAIGGYKSTIDEHHTIGQRQRDNLNNSIQIWKIDCGLDISVAESPHLEMVLCHDFGCAFDLQWCPYGAYDKLEDAIDQQNIFIPKLGIIAISFGNGSIGIFAIPKPKNIRKLFDLSPDETLFVKFTSPLYTFSLPKVMCWTLSWGGHRKIATGCTNGDIAIWNIEEILTEKISQGEIRNSEITSPMQYFRAHDSCVRQVSWNSMQNPSHIMSCGHDGRLQIIDDRDPWVKNNFQRIRAYLMTACWPNHYGGVLFADTENTVRYIRMEDLKKTTGVMMHHAIVWRIAASYFHPFVASCSSDGTVKMTNICRLRDRHQKPIQVTLYRIGIEEDMKTIRYWDNIKSEETTTTFMNNKAFSHFFMPEVAIQRVRLA